MCRTGRVFRPVVGERKLDLELVGALRYNSVYRDDQTGSWWYQADGRAAAGPLVGEVLPQIPADHMTLEQWLHLYPDSDVMQPDPASEEGYQMFGFARLDSSRPKEEHPLGWQWVLSVASESRVKAYPWSHLGGERLVQDDLGNTPIAIHVLEDMISFRVWNRQLNGRTLDLELAEEGTALLDSESGSTFGFDGVGRGGAFDGSQLEQITGNIEYRHSFETFTGGEIYDPEQHGTEAAGGEAQSASP